MSTAPTTESPPIEPHDPDDFFKDTRMSFSDHIEDLRSHLWRAIYGFLIALFASVFIGKYVLDAITLPVKKQLEAYYDRLAIRVVKEKEAEGSVLTQPSTFRRLVFLRSQMDDFRRGQPFATGQPVRIAPGEEGKELVEEGKIPIPADEWDEKVVELWVADANPLGAGIENTKVARELLKIDSPTTLRAEEAFFVWFKVCLVTGLVLGSPWIFYEIWSFVAAGLYPEEKRLVHVYLPVSLGLFIAGVAICQFFVIPKALEALLWFNEWLDFKPDIRLNEWLEFAIFMPLVFGLSFQTPLVMLLLNRLGIVSVETFAGQRRMAWMAMAVFAAIITPSTDAISMLFLWVPMSLLFELGILMMWFSPAQQQDDESDDGELVEV